MKKCIPTMLMLIVLAWPTPVKAQQRVTLFIETPCQANSSPELLASPEEKLIEIFPNPSQGDFTLSFDQSLLSEEVEIGICDSHGKSIWLIRMEVTDVRYPVHLPGVACGLYFVTVTSGQSISQEKLIIY